MSCREALTRHLWYAIDDLIEIDPEIKFTIIYKYMEDITIIELSPKTIQIWIWNDLLDDKSLIGWKLMANLKMNVNIDFMHPPFSF